jgi:hypothetical protein
MELNKSDSVYGIYFLHKRCVYQNVCNLNTVYQAFIPTLLQKGDESEVRYVSFPLYCVIEPRLCV